MRRSKRRKAVNLSVAFVDVKITKILKPWYLQLALA
jgi:hypothetical protein